MKCEFFTVELVMKYGVPNLRFFGRDEQKNKIVFDIQPHRPYMYVPKDEHNNSDDLIQQKHYFLKSIYGDDIVKVVYENPFDMKTIKSRFTKTFEGDIQYPQRVLIDLGIHSGVEYSGNNKISQCPVEVTPKIFTLDIETEYYGGSNYEMTCPLNAVSFHDNYEDKIYTISFNKDHTLSEREFEYPSEVLKEGNEPKKIRVKEHIVKDEKELLLKLKEYVINLDPDIFVGWNINFDMIYILRRMEVLGLGAEDLSPLRKYYYMAEKLNTGSFKNALYKKNEKKVMIRGRAIIDLLKGYKRLKWKQIDSFRLDDIGQKEFGVGKISYTGWIGDFWKNDFENFLKYNRRDVEITLAVDKQYSVIEMLLNLRRITGCELSDVHFNSRMIDIYTLRKCYGKLILPSRIFRDFDDREKIEGGFVLEPKVGVFRNIVILDLKSLYPSIMLSMNMSPETIDKDGEIKLPNGTRFKSETGILKEILMDLLFRRDELRKQLKEAEVNQDKSRYLNIYKKQYAFKTFTNSLYGVTLYPSFRLFDSRIGAAITYTGRFLAKRMMEYCESKGFTVIRADTDSVFVDVHEDNKEIAVTKGKQLEAEINTMFPIWFLGWNNDVSYISVKFEKLYDTLFTGKEKKLYGGNISWNYEKGFLDEFEADIKGFAAKRSDRSHFARELQTKVFGLIFKHASKGEIINFIYGEIDNFLGKKYSYEDIGVPKAITKDIDEYEKESPWIRGVKWSEKHIVGYVFSPKPHLLYVKKNGKYDTDAICFDNSNQVPTDIDIDWEKMCEVSITNILDNIFEVLEFNPGMLSEYVEKKIHGQMNLSSYGK